MKSLKKTLVLLVVLSMIFSTFVPAFAATDVADLDCEDAVLRMEALDIIAGFEDGTFRPDETITRAQMAVIVCKMTGITEAAAEASKSVDSKFTDVKAGDWYTGYINIAAGNGIIAGFPDGTFRPNEVLTLNQVLTLCVKALGRGAYVDQMGTWPANYVTEAAKLGLLDDVKSNSTDANRGNVAIIAWNTMKAPCWDVNTTKLDGEVSLSDARNTTLLSTHFRNFVHEDAKGNKFLKEATSFKVAKAPSMEKDLGERQIVLEYLDTTANPAVLLDKDFEDFEDAIKEGAPKKNEETATYYDDEYADNRLVVYVPEEVNDDLEALYGKEVTVIFGEDNEAALIIVTDDATIDNDFVTKYNKVEKKLTIAGNEYKILDTSVEVYVNGLAFGTGIDQIEKVLTKVGADVTSTRTITKALKANVILNSKDKVERIDFTLSGEYYVDNSIAAPIFETEANKANAEYIISEKIVKDIKSKGDVKDLDNATLYNYKDLMEEEIEPKVLKDGKEIALDEIAEGDVLTIVSAAPGNPEDIQTIYVSSEKVSGEIANVNRSLAVKIDGTTYYAATGAYASTTGDIEDAGTTVDYALLKNVDEEEAELYLNILGEYVALVCETDAADGVFAMVRRVGEVRDDADDEEYVKLYVTLTDGTETSYTVKYDDKASETTTGTPKMLKELPTYLQAGDVVRVKANDERLALIEDIEIVTAGTDVATHTTATTGTINDTDVVAVKVAAGTVDFDDEIVKVSAGTPAANYELDFSGTIFMNYDGEEVDIASKGWKTLVGDNQTVFASTKLGAANATYFIEKTDSKFVEVVLVCSKVTSYNASDVQFAIVTDVDNKANENGKEDITLLLANGETATYEVATTDVETGDGRIEIGDFVQFKTSEDKIVADSLIRVIDVVALTSVGDETLVANNYVNMTETYIKGVCGCGGIHTANPSGTCDGTGSPATHQAPMAAVLTAINASTTKEHLVFDYNPDKTNRIYYNDDLTNSLGYVRISDDGANIIDLREMDLDTAEGVAFLTDVDLEDLDGERIIAIDADPEENGAELLVVISAK